MRRITQIIILVFAVTSSLYAELSKDQVKDIAKQYAHACADQDFGVWQELYYQPVNTSESEFKRAIQSGGSGVISPSMEPKNIRIKKVDGLNVYIQIQAKNGSRDDGWLQLLPNGKIKYDPIVFPHPIPIAFQHYGIINMVPTDNTQFANARKSSCREIKETGIPLFDFDSQAPIHEQKKALEAIKEWLVENGAEWDSSEPKLACPEDQFKDCLKLYK